MTTPDMKPNQKMITLAFSTNQTSKKIQRNTCKAQLLSTNQKPNQNQEREQKDEEK
jgi:hypothetical protein